MMPPMTVLLDYAGVGFFAASGAIAAAERRQDIVTFLFFAALAGLGGGTLRDLLIDAPVFWVERSGYLLVCGFAALIAWFTPVRLLGHRGLLWVDAVGLVSYAIVGSGKAYAYGLAAPVCVVMGVLTACFGGVLRDVVAEQPSVLLRHEIYVTAAILAASVHIGLLWLGAPAGVAVLGGIVAGFTLRAGALLKGWQMPGYRYPTE